MGEKIKIYVVSGNYPEDFYAESLQGRTDILSAFSSKEEAEEEIRQIEKEYPTPKELKGYYYSITGYYYSITELDLVLPESFIFSGRRVCSNTMIHAKNDSE